MINTFFKLSWRDRFYIIYSFFIMPALILHELAHLIMAIILFQTVTEFKIHFPTIRNNQIYCKGVVTTSHSEGIINRICAILIAIAPILLFSLLLIDNFFIKLYVVLCLNVFIPSKQDWLNAKNSLIKIKELIKK